MASDIQQAFLQIYMVENDGNYSRMIWFDNALSTNTTMKLLRFTKLVFRLISSPFVLNGTEKFIWKSFSRITKRKVLLLNYSETYMFRMLQPVLIVLMKVPSFDDVTTSFDSINEGIRFYGISKSCLSKGQFALRK